jgi:DNA-binding transcriptional LysR family regulator
MAHNETKFMESAVALSEELNFTRAAIKNGVSQSTITKNIKGLERELGIRLFERNRKNVYVTDAGRAYVEKSRISLQYAERAFEAARAVEREADDIQRVGRSPYTDPFFITTLLSIELSLYPQMRIQVSNPFSYDLVHDLFSGGVDLAVANDPPPSPLLTSHQIAESPFYIGMSKRDELAKNPSVTLDAMADRYWILFERRLHPPVYDAVMQRAEQRKIAPSRVQHITIPEDAFPFVAEEGGLVFLTKAGALRMARKGVTVRPLAEETLRVKTYLVSLADNKSKVTSELVRAFMKKLGNIDKASHSPLALSA